MRAGASNIAIIPCSAKSVTAQNTTAFSSSGKRCRASDGGSTEDLKRRTLTRETVLAAVVRLLDTEHIRIGQRAICKDQ